VTGGAAGIGAAAAMKLAAAGHPVTVATLRAGEGGEEIVDQITAAGGVARLAFGDLADEEAVAAIHSTASEAFGAPGILVHAAGGFTRSAGLVDTPSDEWDRVIAVNLRSTYLCMHAALPAMIEGGWGRVVTVASEAGRVPLRIGSPAYAAAKAAVIGLTKHVAREVAGTGVTVNATAPSTTLSPRVRDIYQGREDEVAALHPMGRLSTPEEQAAVIAFLCTEGASYVNGSCVDVTGGSVTL